MSFFKEQRFESPKLLAAANGAPCMHCGLEVPTVVGAHYTGFRQHRMGKGRGIKCSDSYAAYLCDECHKVFDQPEHKKSTSASEAFLFAIAKTHHYALVNGILVVA